MKNFEKFGIKNLSYSSLTNFHYSRGNWIIEKLLGHKFPYNPPAIRGFAVEKAVENYYTTNSQPLENALKYYDLRIEEEGAKYGFANDEEMEKYSKSVKKERGVVEKTVPKAIAHIEKSLDTPTFLMAQKKIEIEICDIKFIGYIDFEFYSKHQHIILDLKTSSVKTGLKHSHSLQQSIYWKATGINPALLYVYPSGEFYKLLHNMNTYFAHIEKMVIAMDRFLGMVESTQEIIDLTQPDFDDWKWDSQKKQTRKEVFGI